MHRLVELVGWKVRLWLVRTLDTLKYERRRRSSRDIWTTPNRLERAWQKVFSLENLIELLERVAPYTGPGKFEGNGPEGQLKAEWLYEQSLDWDSARLGDIDEWGLAASLLIDADVPWSRKPETWTITEDARGFVDIFPGRERFDILERAYNAEVEE